MNSAFKPIFAITNRIAAGLIERAQRVLEAATNKRMYHLKNVN